MEQTEQPPERISQDFIANGGRVATMLAFSVVLLFSALWFVLGALGLAQLSRMVIAICVTPALIAAIVGSYVLFGSPRE